ncbi:GrpB family protein [Legionella tunisiensis]|uniref:GrpB family protein n=1 Tax=Legionella tunisiensis TaxID=1034944 RepID=UPI0002EF2F0D|nr:GrpB family protein [Legionella tunisiensis]
MSTEYKKSRQVVLVPYDKQWPFLFTQEEQRLATILQQRCLAIHHIGSTAIPQIHAKPIIDILPVVDDIEQIDALNPDFEALGYTCMGEYGIKGRRFFWKSKSQRSHNIHIFAQNSPEIARHLAFRDFLVNNPAYAQAYSLIKQSLAAVFADDIENYVNGKASFIQSIDYKTGQCSQEQLDAADDIVISTYNPAWPLLAQAEIDTITAFSKPLDIVAIEHLGSTAVP